MKNQIKLIAALTLGVTFASSAGISEAGRPFGMFSSRSSQSSQNYSTRNQAQMQQPAAYTNNILQSPERMEKIYGPSILVRGEANTTVSTVSQP